MNLPPNFESDWKKIGSKRTEMMMLDMPLWPKQVRKKTSETTTTSTHSKSTTFVQVEIH